MIIEDGDVCLVPRKNDNISTIASLLNLSDGILGSIIDIKMVISTNADIKDMDQAIMRPGRLCKNIHVGPLPYEQANQVYRRLMKSEDVKLEYKKLYTLAEIYDITNNAGNTSHSYNAGQNRRVIGFSSSREDAVMNKKIGF
jgi:ATP-dependent 26S proteasome regulatory subunit